MYKLVDTFGDRLFLLFLLGGGILLTVYLVGVLRVRGYVLALCAYVVYAPAIKVLGLNFGAGVNPVTGFTLLLLILWLSGPGRPPIPTPLKGLLIAWMGLNILSIFANAGGNSYVRFPGAIFDLKRALDCVFPFFFALGVREHKEVKAIVVSVAASAIMAGVYTYIQRITWFQPRIPGMLGHVNQTMSFLTAYVPIALALFIGARSLVTKVGVLAALYVIGRGLIATGSRMGFLAAGGACLVVVVLSRNRLLILGCVVAVALFIAQPKLLPDTIYYRYLEMVGGEGEGGTQIAVGQENADLSVSSRFIIWSGGLEMIRRSPFVGSGLNTFERRIEEYLVPYAGMFRARNAHNAYIQTAAELGIPALIVLLLTFFIALLQSFTVFRRHPEPSIRVMALGVFGATVAVIVSNMTSANFQDVEVMLSFYVLTGLMAVMRTEVEPATAPLRRDAPFAGRALGPRRPSEV